MDRGLDQQGGNGFTIRCNKCGKTQDITTDNIADHFSGYAWGVHEPPEYAKKDKILMWYTEDLCNETITCSCGNEVRG